MKSLDYYVQLWTIIALLVLQIAGVFFEDLKLLAFLLMLIFGIYQICHFILYSIHKYLVSSKFRSVLIIYPIFCTCFITIFGSLWTNHGRFLILHIMPLIAISIGCYYFYSVHKKNLRTDFKFY